MKAFLISLLMSVILAQTVVAKEKGAIVMNESVFEADATSFKIVGKIDLNQSAGLVEAQLETMQKGKAVWIYRDLANRIFPSPQIPVKVFFVYANAQQDEVHIVGVAMNNDYRASGMIQLSGNWLKSHAR